MRIDLNMSDNWWHSKGQYSSEVDLKGLELEQE